MRRLVPLIFVVLLAGCHVSHGMRGLAGTAPIYLPVQSAGIVDARARFREIFCAIRMDHGAQLPDDRPCGAALHRLDDEPVPTGRPVSLADPAMSPRIVVVPGIFGECVASIARPLDDAAAHLRAAHGYRVDILRVSGRSGSTHNAGQIRAQLAALGISGGPPVIIVGYSKGTSDLLEMIERYPEALPAGSAIVSMAGVIAGTPIADRLQGLYEGTIAKMPYAACPPGDGDEIASLTRARRMAWLAAHPLPVRYRYFSVAGFAASKSISLALKPFHAMLAEADERNDGQMLLHDALFPGGTLLGYANADHWALVLPFNRNPSHRPPAYANRNAFPREVLLEAVVRTIAETPVR